MSFLKRTLISIKRQPFKNGILFMLILLLATTFSGALSVRNAIRSTEESMLLRLPAIGALGLNAQTAADEMGILVSQLEPSFWHTDLPTIDEINALGNLPYVHSFDLLMTPTLLSRDLEWVGNGGVTQFGGYVESFTVHGVLNPHLIDVEAGLIELVSGRTFTEAEISNGEHVVIISNELAIQNQLSVGEVVTLENNVYDMVAFFNDGIGNWTLYWHDEEYMLAHQLLHFEIIGIFDVLQLPNMDTPAAIHASDISVLAEQINYINNRIYIPVSVTEDTLIFYNEGMRLQFEEVSQIFTGDAPSFDPDNDIRIQGIFVLNDPRDLANFAEVGSQMLPGHWEVTDFRAVDNRLLASTDWILTLADYTLAGTVLATILILTLVVSLIFKERQHEIGIYMALGECKKKIIILFLSEIFIIAISAMIFALFLGNILSGILSGYLLEQHLIENIRQTGVISATPIPWEIALFNPGRLSIEELMEMYNTSLSFFVILKFIGIFVGGILLGISIPLFNLFKLEPKKVLM